MTTLTATTYAELAIRVTGTFIRGYPERGPTYDCGGEPAEPDGVEDLDVEDIMIINRTYVGGTPVDTEVSILAGVDRSSEAYRVLVRNLLASLGDQAVEALLEEAGQ